MKVKVMILGFSLHQGTFFEGDPGIHGNAAIMQEVRVLALRFMQEIISNVREREMPPPTLRLGPL